MAVQTHTPPAVLTSIAPPRSIEPVGVEPWRYERKFIALQDGIESVASLVSRHRALFRQAYPPRHVNNLYLDTLTRAHLRENEAGVSDRMKVRVRWYGDLFGRVADPMLEIKQKKNTMGRKDRHRIAEFVLDRCFTAETLRDAFGRSDLPVRLRVLLQTLEVSLLNRYHRSYYISSDGRFRLTLDTALEYYAVRPAWNTFLARWIDPVSTVIELKYGVEDDAGGHEIASALPFRAERNSKYVVGLHRVGL